MAEYGQYAHLLFERREHGVLLMTINRPEALNATNAVLHRDLSRVWAEIDADAETRVVVVTGMGRAFSAGGDLDMIEGMCGDFATVERMVREASEIVYQITNMEKPVVAAINGVAVGAGLAVALMADITVMSETARITDGHLRLGVAAGDHAVMIWPLLCGMAKAKYYLLTSDFIDGREAERIGLVSLAVPQEDVLPRALEIAERLARGPQSAVRWTKRALNNWLRVAGPAFETSMALEMLGFLGPDAREGVRALRENRAPEFPSARDG